MDIVDLSQYIIDGSLDLENKIEIIPSEDNDIGCMTFAIHREDHTIGNALRYVLMKNPDVDLCAYSIPHPSEDKIHFRVQTAAPGISAIDIMQRGLDDLISMITHIATTFESRLNEENYTTADVADF